MAYQYQYIPRDTIIVCRCCDELMVQGKCPNEDRCIMNGLPDRNQCGSGETKAQEVND